MAQDGLRKPFETVEQGLQFSILLSGGAKHGHDGGSELHIDGFAFGLIGPLEIGTMALSRIVAASALGFAALHHALEKRTFAEVIQVLEFLL